MVNSSLHQYGHKSTRAKRKGWRSATIIIIDTRPTGIPLTPGQPGIKHQQRDTRGATRTRRTYLCPLCHKAKENIQWNRRDQSVEDFMTPLWNKICPGHRVLSEKSTSALRARVNTCQTSISDPRFFQTLSLVLHKVEWPDGSGLGLSRNNFQAHSSNWICHELDTVHIYIIPSPLPLLMNWPHKKISRTHRPTISASPTTRGPSFRFVMLSGSLQTLQAKSKTLN